MGRVCQEFIRQIYPGQNSGQMPYFLLPIMRKFAGHLTQARAVYSNSEQVPPRPVTMVQVL